MEGESSYIDGSEWFGTMRYEDPFDGQLRRSGHPRWDPTGLQLRDLDERLLTSLIAGSPDAPAWPRDFAGTSPFGSYRTTISAGR